MIKNEFLTPEINLVEDLTSKLITANQNLEQANKKLIEAETLQKEMLSNISHDLRAPLTAIRGALDRLFLGVDLSKEEKSAMISVINRRITTLEHLVKDLYYSVSLEQTGFVLNKEIVPANAFLEEWFIIRKCDDSCAQRELKFEPQKDQDPLIYIDTERMLRVFDNLMENALRFSKPQTPISLGFRTNNNIVEIYLKDIGCGIAPEDILRIFERTYTASSSRTPQQKEGSGLGLSIAKTIVEKHGGSIYCESSINVGTTFWIQLPIVTHAKS